MDTLDTKENQVPRAAQESDKAGNKDTHALEDPRTPPRKPPAARDKLKTLAMPKALKI